MTAVKYIPKRDSVHLAYVSRQSSTNKEKANLIHGEEQFYSTTNVDTTASETIFRAFSQSVPQHITTNKIKVQNIDDNNIESKSNTMPTTKTDRFSLNTKSNLNNLSPIKQNTHDSSGCFRYLTCKKKNLCKIIVPIAVLGIILAAVLPPVLLLIIRRINIISSTTNITVSPCLSTTCINKETPFRTSMVTVLYPFNGNINDSSGSVAGIPYGTPTYITQAYVGSRALSLDGPGSNDYIEIPYINLTNRSFTIQIWLYLGPSSVSGDYGIFSQCDSNLICLSISLRDGRFTLSFDSMNTTNNTLFGSILATAREWTHLTVVYDAILYQQQIYVNGGIDVISSGIVASYRGTSLNSTTTVGSSKSFAYGLSLFQGRIDHFTISAGVTRTACQIYNDATLVAYYPFDTVGTFDDHSVNLLNGISSNTTLISEGRVGQAIYFSTNISYFQAQCFSSMRNTAATNPPFTITLWINPAKFTVGGSVIHISNLANGGGTSCYDLLAFTSTGALVVQIMESTTSVIGLQGPVLSTNTWTHVTIMYSREDGLRLLINGEFNVASSITNIPFIVTKWDVPLYITLGNNSPLGPSAGITCQSGSIPFLSGPYTGAIDDFRLYNRELDTQELCVLINV